MVTLCGLVQMGDRYSANNWSHLSSKLSQSFHTFHITLNYLQSKGIAEVWVIKTPKLSFWSASSVPSPISPNPLVLLTSSESGKPCGLLFLSLQIPLNVQKGSKEHWLVFNFTKQTFILIQHFAQVVLYLRLEYKCFHTYIWPCCHCWTGFWTHLEIDLASPLIATECSIGHFRELQSTKLRQPFLEVCCQPSSHLPE